MLAADALSFSVVLMRTCGLFKEEVDPWSIALPTSNLHIGRI